jgi:rSAM/selenodomain-associated transferase 1
MAADILALFAKAPVAGQVKTRLVPHLRAEEAAELYRAMLLDIACEHAESPPTANVELALWYSPAEARAWFEAEMPGAYRLLPQRGPDLSARMAELFRTHTAEGAQRIVLRGTDSPTLPLDRVAEAFRRLEQTDLVLCPDRDGGYNLIGLRRACDPLFDLEMSTASVLDTTLQRAAELGLRCELLPPHYDVDTAEDLELLRRDTSPRRARRTHDWLVSPRASMDS